MDLGVQGRGGVGSGDDDIYVISMW
jgi:hypothetical protein